MTATETVPCAEHFASPEFGRSNTSTAAQHLTDARTHLQRCLIEIKNATQADPGLLTRLGSRYAALQAEAEELEGVRVLGGNDNRAASAAAVQPSISVTGPQQQ